MSKKKKRSKKGQKALIPSLVVLPYVNRVSRALGVNRNSILARVDEPGAREARMIVVYEAIKGGLAPKVVEKGLRRQPGYALSVLHRVRSGEDPVVAEKLKLLSTVEREK